MWLLKQKKNWMNRQNSGELWDDEFYIVLEDIKDRIAELNLEMEYTQISFCAGVVILMEGLMNVRY